MTQEPGSGKSLDRALCFSATEVRAPHSFVYIEISAVGFARTRRAERKIRGGSETVAPICSLVYFSPITHHPLYFSPFSHFSSLSPNLRSDLGVFFFFCSSYSIPFLTRRIVLSCVTLNFLDYLRLWLCASF